MSDPIPFVVTEALSKIYYKGLPSKPPLIATTKPGPFGDPPGPGAYSVLKELRELCDHPLATAWDHGLADRLHGGLNAMCVLRIVEVGEPSDPAIVWIGVDVVAHKCHTFIDSHGIYDYISKAVKIQESHVMRQADNRFLDFVPSSDPTFTARDPYTTTLGILISAKDRPWAEGTGGFYLSAGRDDKNIYLVTARHVVLPIDKDDNKEYECKNDSKVREDVVVLGTSSFNEKLVAIDYKIRGQESAIADAKERIKSVKDMDNPVWKAEKGLKALRAFRHEIATHWGAKEKRVFGELVRAPPIILSTESGQYTLDLAVIKFDMGKFDAKNYRGNSINIGNKYIRHEFMNKVYLHHINCTSFKFPASCLVTFQVQVPESALVKPPMLDANGNPCLGSMSKIAAGDSGSCVADIFGRVGGIVTGGSGATESSDVTYITPITFIMKVLHILA
ncbi:hypothetical protein V8B97DRAFT_2021693 [Scleroderma yunnanense]